MKLQVSIGEALDKYSILEIKYKLIKNLIKRKEVSNEIDKLEPVKEYCSKYSYYYKLLIYINEKIWIETDLVKSLQPNDKDFAIKSHSIFEMNQQRFRLKNIINNLENGSIKEQKGYIESGINLKVTDVGVAIPVINYLSLMYDYVVLENAEILKNLFVTSNISYGKEKDLPSLVDVDVSHPKIFESDVIIYLAGGKLGDFIHQLSVVFEKFLKTGKKGKIYITEEVGDSFYMGLVETFNDIFPFISKLPYVDSLLIYKGEKIDFNLSSWRMQPNIQLYSWQEIFYFSYDVDWGRNAWLASDVNSNLKDVILISTNPTRWNNNIDWHGLFNCLKGPFLFLNTNVSEYDHFCSKAKTIIPSLDCSSFIEMASAIQSCKLLVGNLSLPLAIADGMRKKRIAIIPSLEKIGDILIAKKSNDNWIDENTNFNLIKFNIDNPSLLETVESFSQFGEDIFIAEYFEPGYKGICIDIGATDGIGLSNTYRFERIGWRAICIEANPAMIPSLRENRDFVVHCAVGCQDNREVDFKVVTLMGGNQTAISGLVLDERLLKSHAYLNPEINTVKIQQRTLNNIINDFDWVSQIDFISIDTEGTELDVLKGFDIERWNVKLFCIENNFNDPEIELYLEGFGYKKVRRFEVNDFYTRMV